MLQLLSTDSRIINIDETWLAEADFRKRLWTKRGFRSSVAEKVISPRISVIAAIDTEGELFVSLTQVNTDSAVICLFLSQLASKLTKTCRNWKANTILVLDGAAYHRSEITTACARQLNLKVVISAPYSYSSAPIELFFAYLKQSDINPRNESTGKR